MTPGQDFLTSRSALRVDPPSTRSRSPMSGNRAGEDRGREFGAQTLTFPSAGPVHSGTAHSSPTKATGDFFEDELRVARV